MFLLISILKSYGYRLPGSGGGGGIEPGPGGGGGKGVDPVDEDVMGFEEGAEMPGRRGPLPGGGGGTLPGTDPPGIGGTGVSGAEEAGGGVNFAAFFGLAV